MFKFKFVLCSLIFGMSLQNALANDTDTAAMQKTQDCLRSQNCELVNPDMAKAADQKALEAAGGNAAGKQALYNISADIMPVLEKQSEGDPAKMQALILKAQTDPEGFLKSLPPDIQAKIKGAAVAPH